MIKDETLIYDTSALDEWPFIEICKRQKTKYKMVKEIPLKHFFIIKNNIRGYCQRFSIRGIRSIKMGESV